MLTKKRKLSLILTLAYWLPSCYAMYDIVSGAGDFSFSILGLFFLPAYLISIVLGYGGGNVFIIIGQLISLLLTFLLVSAIVDLTVKSRNSVKKNNNKIN